VKDPISIDRKLWSSFLTARGDENSRGKLQNVVAISMAEYFDPTPRFSDVVYLRANGVNLQEKTCRTPPQR